MNLQFTKQIELTPHKNTKKYFLSFWLIFFISSIFIGLYTSCDYQSSIYQKVSCNKILLMAGQNYPMRSNNDDIIFITPLTDLFWDGRNGLKYNCYSNITFIKVDILNSITADINFIGSFICNQKPWMTLSDTTMNKSPIWMKDIINNTYRGLNENFTIPYSILFDINNKIQTVFTNYNKTNITFNINIFKILSQYTDAINNLDIAISYQCRSCYYHMDTFGFQSFVKLIITMGTMLSFATIISTKVIPLFLNYKYELTNELSKC